MYTTLEVRAVDILTFIKPIVDLGLTPVLLLLFTKHFFEKDKQRDKQLESLQLQFEKRETQLQAESLKREDQYKERERIIVAESARREEIIKKESEKREKIIRDESEKRESALLTTIESFSKTMKEISDTMNENKKITGQIQNKIDNMGNVLEQLYKGGENGG